LAFFPLLSFYFHLVIPEIVVYTLLHACIFLYTMLHGCIFIYMFSNFAHY
jgi:hypothetical protein